MTLHEESFSPPVVARREANDVSIVVDPKVQNLAPWLYYGGCKAVWLRDGGHRQEKTGEEEHYWTSIEERECLAGLVSVYGELRVKGTAKGDPRLDRVHDIVADGFIDEFILYEMATRIDPHFMPTVGDEVKARMREYISRYVVMPRGDT